MFKCILVATDLTPRADSAVRIAAALAQQGAGEVVVLHVVPMPEVLKRWSAPIFRLDRQAYRSVLERQLQAAQKEVLARTGVILGAAKARHLVKAGDPAETIAETADAVRADLIVVARGRGGRLGPTAERVVRLAGRAVLVAPVQAGTRPTLRGGERRARGGRKVDRVARAGRS